jgi:hypothetical protein
MFSRLGTGYELDGCAAMLLPSVISAAAATLVFSSTGNLFLAAVAALGGVLAPIGLLTAFQVTMCLLHRERLGEFVDASVLFYLLIVIPAALAGIFIIAKTESFFLALATILISMLIVRELLSAGQPSPANSPAPDLRESDDSSPPGG